MSDRQQHLFATFVAGLTLGALIRVTWRRKPASAWSAYPALAGNFAL